MSVDLIEMWHQRARPEPTHEDWNVQLGCHFEELLEMLQTIKGEDGHTENMLAQTRLYISRISDRLKFGQGTVYIEDREGFLDSVADQVVTVIGTATTAGMQGAEAVRRVNTSNWSKFDTDGTPIKDANGKITKGPNYQRPDLIGLFE